MPEYLAPGVFVEEIGPVPPAIVGVPTSDAAMLGETERGPLRPRRLTSLAEYASLFGGDAGSGRHLPDAVRGFFDNGGQRLTVCRVVGAGAARAVREAGGLRIAAIGPGAWGNRLFVKLSPAATPASGPARFHLQIAFWSTSPPGPPRDPFADPAAPRPTVAEEFRDLTWHDPAAPDHFERRLEGRSALIHLPAGQTPSAAPTADFAALSGGRDGAAPTVTDFAGEGDASGLAALDGDAHRDVALVAAPAAPEDVTDAVVAHCERNRFRFAVVDCRPGQVNAAALDPGARRASGHAAFYYPWIRVAGPGGSAPRLVPPSGHVLGLYARTDANRGVWKAPANDGLRGAIGLEFVVTKQVQDILNPRGVNVIRPFTGKGILVWGARTLSTDNERKYISVRRLLSFIEASVERGTLWAVFEPNDARLWQRVRAAVELFLLDLWRNGALIGSKPEAAFYVRCGLGQTMTQADLLNGQLICEIGLAVVRPAEYIILRFSHRISGPDD